MICVRVALQFIHEMQCKALKSWDASKSQALPVFGVDVAFIDESVLSLNPSHEVDQAIEDIRSIVSDLGPPHKELHITPIESIYSLECMEGRNRLKELLLAITDATGKEDFLHHLRMCSLQKVLFSVAHIIFLCNHWMNASETIFLTYLCFYTSSDCFG